MPRKPATPRPDTPEAGRGASAPKGKGGRPRVHDRAAIMAAVCDRIATGELMQDVAADLGVSSWSVTQWAADPEFATAYARAREAQAHAIAARAYRDAVHADREDAQAARLRFDAGRWLASKIAPRDYGDRQTVEHAGDPAAPLTVRVVYDDAGAGR